MVHNRVQPVAGTRPAAVMGQRRGARDESPLQRSGTAEAYCRNLESTSYGMSPDSWSCSRNRFAIDSTIRPAASCPTERKAPIFFEAKTQAAGLWRGHQRARCLRLLDGAVWAVGKTGIAFLTRVIKDYKGHSCGQQRARDAAGGPRSNYDDEIPQTKLAGTGSRVADQRPRGALPRQRQKTIELFTGRHSRELFDHYEPHDRG